MAVMTSPAERQRRSDICRTCPNVRTLGRTNFMRCSLCGCPLASKTRFQGASCPAGKW